MLKYNVAPFHSIVCKTFGVQKGAMYLLYCVDLVGLSLLAPKQMIVYASLNDREC